LHVLPVCYTIKPFPIGGIMQNTLKPRTRHERLFPRTITIEDSYWEFAKKYGEGNASRGIRTALYAAADLLKSEESKNKPA
jgi:hypothetical protein